MGHGKGFRNKETRYTLDRDDPKRSNKDRGEKTTRDRKRNGDSRGWERGGGWLVLGRVELSQRWSVRLREREMER